MMQPPSSLPNFSLPPPGFPPFSSSDSGTQTASDANQELWVETKAGDGKVPDLLCTVINYYPVFLSKSMHVCT